MIRRTVTGKTSKLPVFYHAPPRRLPLLPHLKRPSAKTKTIFKDWCTSFWVPRCASPTCLMKRFTPGFEAIQIFNLTLLLSFVNSLH
jgi:hypothetical protein